MHPLPQAPCNVWGSLDPWPVLRAAWPSTCLGNGLSMAGEGSELGPVLWFGGPGARGRVQCPGPPVPPCHGVRGAGTPPGAGDLRHQYAAWSTEAQ